MDDNNEIEQLFKDLTEIENVLSVKEDDVEIDEPIYDEYFSATVFDYLSHEFEQEEKGAKPKLKDPKGGLTAAGRAHFKRTEGANLKPGVKGAADTPEKMRRKGSFLTRFFTNPSGPMKDEKGRATRLALSAAAWGEPVPGDAAAAAKLAAKGRRLLERYERTKKKSEEVETESKQLPGQTIGQQGSGAIGAGDAGDGVDRDGDGVIFDGTENEQRAPYKRSSNADYEKRRRAWVRGRLNSQGIKPNARVQDRTTEERNARAAARAEFDRRTYADGIRAQQEEAKKRSINSITDSAQRRRANEGVGNVTDAATRRGQTDSRRPIGANDRVPADRADRSPMPTTRPDSADRQRANRGIGNPSDAATRRGQTDARRPTSATDRVRPDGIDNNPQNRRPDSADRQRANRGVGATDAATRRGQTDSRRPTSATDRARPDAIDNNPQNRRPDSAGRQRAMQGVGATDAAARRGQTDARRPTSANDRRGADRTDTSPRATTRPDSADRQRANRGIGNVSDTNNRAGRSEPRINRNIRPVPLPNPSPGDRGREGRPRPIPLPNPRPGEDRGRQNMPYYPRGRNKPDRGTRGTRDF